ncbi:MAG: sigma-E processing peptidase SpoIIGA [Clostridia bacterium]|nr:sigma-E processing peptidase SpoIIGA [Clostridia bacterium]
MEIIIEYVLLDNFLIDSLLLILTNKTLKLPVNKWGVVLASMFGAGFAVVSPLIRVSGILAILLKFSIAFIMVLMSNFTFKKVLVRFALFVFFTFMFGGALIAIFNFLGISVYDSLYVGYVSSLPIGTILVSIIVFAVFMFRLINNVFKSRFYNSNTCDVEVELNGKVAKIKGFVDTGNTLHNSLGKPVLVVPEKVLSKWFTPYERMLLLLDENKLKLKNYENITVGSLGGNYKMKVFDCSIVLNGENKEIALGVAFGKLNCGGCQAILGQEIAEVVKC